MRAVVVAPSPPIRSCIGCRRRVVAAELFRVVAAPGPAGTTSARGSSPQLERGAVVVSVVPDPRRRLPGRGAWLHPAPDCVALATRRHAFGRALRVPGPVDVTAVVEHVTRTVRKEQGQARHQHTTSGSTAGDDEQ